MAFNIIFKGQVPALRLVSQGDACAYFGNNICDPVNMLARVKMKNCENFLIYYLYPPITCNSAYCTGMHAIGTLLRL